MDPGRNRLGPASWGPVGDGSGVTLSQCVVSRLGTVGLNRPQRWLAATAIAWSLTNEGVLLLVLIVAAARAIADRPSNRPDHGSLATYVAPIAALSTMTLIPVDMKP